MRINNYISANGHYSRRQADELIKAKKVKLNGRTAQLTDRVEPGDLVELNNKPVVQRKKRLYIALNKPKGIVSTTDTRVKNNIIDFIGHEDRIFPVGRLDKDSEGLILLTNDGTIVNEILRSENNHTKEYLVSVDKPITMDFVKKMSAGVRIFNPVINRNVRTKPAQVTKINEYSFKIVLSQGLNRQIRRMSHALGYEVVKLKRVKIMHISVKGLPLGSWRYLTDSEVKNFGFSD